MSCSSQPQREGGYRFPEDIIALENAVRNNPADYTALRDLGLIYYQFKEYSKAQYYLHRAQTINQNDDQVTYYLGLSYDEAGQVDSAFALFSRYVEFPSRSLFRGPMQSRYRAILRDRFDEAQFSAISDSAFTLEARARVAVFPLIQRDTNSEYEPIGGAFSELLRSDLSNHSSFSTVDRLQSQNAFQVISYGPTFNLSQNAATRLGRMFQSDWVVWGAYQVSANRTAMLEVYAWQISTKTFGLPVQMSVRLDSIVRAERTIVSTILSIMRATITRAPSKVIVPLHTESFPAFQAYAQGLVSDEEGDFENANTQYQLARSLDPQFALAEIKANAFAGRNAAVERPAPKRFAQRKAQGSLSAVQRELINARLRNLGNNFGAALIPGQELREGAEEAIRLLVLPVPPPPPAVSH